MTFRVDCPNCKKQAVVGDSREVSKGILGTFVKDLYCYCHNVDCCATFIVNVSFCRYLNPPNQTTVQLAAAFLNSLPENERQQALALTNP